MTQQVCQGNGMPKKAAKSRDFIDRQIASEIVTVFKHLQGGSAKQRLTEAKNIVADLLRTKSSDINKINNEAARSALLKQAVGLIDVTTGLQRTYPSTGSNTPRSSEPGNPSVGNKPIEDKIPEPSEGESREDYLKRLVDAGYNLAAATEQANLRYGPTPATVGATTTEVKNHGMGGGRSIVTTKVPPFGVKPGSIKQASIRDVAPWAVSLGVAEPNDIVTLDNSIRSASSIPSYFYDVDAAYSLERIQNQREERQKMRDQKAIKSASEGIPKHLYAYASEYL
jgi:hypothetical protein